MGFKSNLHRNHFLQTFWKQISLCLKKQNHELDQTSAHRLQVVLCFCRPESNDSAMDSGSQNFSQFPFSQMDDSQLTQEVSQHSRSSDVHVLLSHHCLNDPNFEVCVVFVWTCLLYSVSREEVLPALLERHQGSDVDEGSEQPTTTGTRRQSQSASAEQSASERKG